MLVQKLDAFCFHCKHMDCMYTTSKYQFSEKVLVKSGQLFDEVQKAVHFNHRNREECPVSRKPTPEDKIQNKFVELLPKDSIDKN